MNLIGVDVSLTGWSCKYMSEMVVNSFFQATTILILVCTAINFQSPNLHYVNANETHLGYPHLSRLLQDSTFVSHTENLHNTEQLNATFDSLGF
jgi:hypothetical protein